MEQQGTGVSTEELNAISQAYRASTTENNQETPITTIETKVEAPVNVSVEHTEVKEEPIATIPVTETKIEETAIASKSFEDYLVEKSQGKYKSWDDLESELKAPRAEFANDNVKHWNDLAKKGIDLNKEFFELQSLNLESDEMDPEEVILQAMRRKDEYSDLSERTLKRELNKKYNYDQWINKFDENGQLKDGEELSEDDQASQEFMMRDAQKDLDWLRNYKRERTFIPETDPNEVQRMADENRQRVQNFEKFVDDELLTKVTDASIEVKIDENTKETFAYKYSEADRKNAAALMKLLPLGTNILVNRFAEKQADGSMQINDQRVYQSLLRDLTYDEAVANAFKDGMALGKKNYVKEEVKNVSFKAADHNSGNHAPQTEAEAIRLAMKTSGKTFN